MLASDMIYSGLLFCGLVCYMMDPFLSHVVDISEVSNKKQSYYIRSCCIAEFCAL